MTAPSAPGVELFAGCFGVTRGPDGKGGEVVVVEFLPGNGFVVMRPGWSFFYEDDGSCPGAEEWDIIHVEPTREAAEAWLRAYRDAQDAEPERRRAVAEVPADDDGWGPWRTDVSEWNVTTHDVRFECVGGIHKISTRPRTEQPPQPEAAPTPAPDLAGVFASIQRIVDDAKAERDRWGHIAATIRINALHHGASTDDAEAMVRGEKDFIAFVLEKVAAMQEKKP